MILNRDAIQKIFIINQSDQSLQPKEKNKYNNQTKLISFHCLLFIVHSVQNIRTHIHGQ